MFAVSNYSDMANVITKSVNRLNKLSIQSDADSPEFLFTIPVKFNFKGVNVLTCPVKLINMVNGKPTEKIYSNINEAASHPIAWGKFHGIMFDLHDGSPCMRFESDLANELLSK